MKPFISVTLYRIKSFYRDTFTFLFSLILPIVFVLIFGFVFGEREMGSNGYGVKIGVIRSDVEIVKVLGKMENVKIFEFENEADLRNHILKGNIDGGVTFDGEKFNFIINFSTFQQNPFLRTFGESFSKAYSLHEVGMDKGFIKMEEEFIDPGKAQVSSLGYIIPGVLSFSISSAIFTMIALFGYYRKRKVIKRFAVTPINPIIFISGMVLGNFVAGIFSCLLVLLIVQLIFHINFSINWGFFLLSVSSSILGMMALGIVLTALFREPQTANNAGNLLVNIMLFFSGVYFPLDFLPSYLKVFAKFLPLYYVGRALRISLGIEEGRSSFVLTFSFVMISTFLILVFISGRNIFNLEER
ncbi:MAG: ABC transporter permease [Dictyoglomus turgidum]|uniref:ABC transporter permease n=1 Tax=Dictyoglomus turgidum TaxID=513050 RepID=UPI003C791323